MLIILFALLGWVVGIVLNIVINRLPNKAPSKPKLRPFIVRVVAGLIFGLLCWKFGLGVQLYISLIYACLFIVIFTIDLEHRLVLNKITYPTMILAFALSFVLPYISPVKALQGAGFGLLAIGLPFLMYPEGIGIGDVKLGILIGLIIGYPLILWVLLLSVISGGLVGTTLLSLKVKKRTDFIPFAPFLATSAMLILFW